MRWSRLVVVSALVAVLGLPLAVSQILSSPHVARAKAPPTPVLQPARGALERELQLLLAKRPVIPSRGVPILPVRPAIPYGGSCYVALGRCSLTPCVEFARAASPGVVASSSAVVLKLGGVAVNRATPQAAHPGCRGRLGMPEVLRVSGP